MVLCVQPGNVMIGLRAIRPFVSMRPNAQLEIQSARGSLPGDELQHIHVLFALARLQRLHAHLVPGDIDQVRIRKMEVVASDPLRKVEAKAEDEGESVEPARDHRVEITTPELLVVIPGLVFNVAAKSTRDTAYPVRSLLDQGRRVV